jgi:hypothetical protein
MNALHSPLGRLSGPSPLTVEEREKAERSMWHEHGKVLVGTSDPRLKPHQQNYIAEIGRDLFGER